MLPQKKIDEHFMRIALSLARRGTGRTSPNPRVGCVVVSDGAIIGKGYHACCGEDHAELAALRDIAAGQGATLYVNLEPCSHFGRTPPCAPLVVEKGIGRAVIGMIDPDERVRGKGADILRKGGVAVDVGVLEEECRHLNRGFIRRATLGRPWITVKGAVSMDGSMALENGESKWITGPEARAAAHLLRSEHDGVLVGSGTVERDDPELTVRHTCGTSPVRIVLDSGLATSPTARVLGKGCRIYAAPGASRERAERLRSEGAEIATVPRGEKGLCLGNVLADAASAGMTSILVEGGPSVISSFFREGLVDSVSLFLSPRLLGRGIPLSGGISFSCMEETIRFRSCSVRPIGKDFLFEGMPECSPDL